MSTSIASLAAGLAAGSITHSYILDTYGSDVLTQVIGFGVSGGVGTVAATLTQDFIDNEPTGVAKELSDVLDDTAATVIGGVADVLGSIF